MTIWLKKQHVDANFIVKFNFNFLLYLSIYNVKNQINMCLVTLNLLHKWSYKQYCSIKYTFN